MKKSLIIAAVLLHGCGDNRVDEEVAIKFRFAEGVNTDKTHEDLKKTLDMLHTTCPGLHLYKKSINSWVIVESSLPYPFMKNDYGWSNTFIQFNTVIPNTKESVIPDNYYAHGHTCQYRVSSNGEVDIMKRPCASICLGLLAPEQDHNYLIASGKSVIRW